MDGRREGGREGGRERDFKRQRDVVDRCSCRHIKRREKTDVEK